MRVFVSWSGERGRKLAEATSRWLPSVVPGVEPWISTEIRKGALWPSELLRSLDAADAAILCVTGEGSSSPWLTFESGMFCSARITERPVACLSLGAPRSAFAATPVGLFPVFGTAVEDLVGLVRHLLGGGGQDLSARVHASWPRIDDLLRRIPAPHSRAFELISCLPQGMRRMQIDAMPDRPWSTILGWIQQAYEVETGTRPELPAESLRYFDVPAGGWLPTPDLLTSIKTPRLAVLHPATVDKWGDSAAAIAWVLRSTLDEGPRRLAARQSLERDASDLVARQERYRAAHGTYAGALDALEFLPSPGAEIKLEGATALGWAGVFTRDGWPEYLGYVIGDGAGTFPGAPEKEFFPLQARRVRIDELPVAPSEDGRPPDAPQHSAPKAKPGRKETGAKRPTGVRKHRRERH